MTPRLAVQLYSVRDDLANDFDATLAQLADFGYRHVEPYAIEQYIDQLSDGLAKHGLDAPATHADLLGGNRQAIVEAATRLGTQLVIQPWSPPELWESESEIEAFAHRLNQAAAQLSEFNLNVGYHNHEFELQAKHGERTGLEVLADALEPGVKLEVDTYWAYAGGVDVVQLLQRLGDRVTAIHIKDGDGTRDSSTQVAVGSGAIPVQDFLDAASNITIGVVELDDTKKVMLEEVRDSFTWLAGKREWA